MMPENRGRKLLAEGLLDEQMGFMPQRSTHDSRFILESLRDGQIENKGKLFAAFLDLRNRSIRSLTRPSSNSCTTEEPRWTGSSS
jgi:hypothetical protein